MGEVLPGELLGEDFGKEVTFECSFLNSRDQLGFLFKEGTREVAIMAESSGEQIWERVYKAFRAYDVPLKIMPRR